MIARLSMFAILAVAVVADAAPRKARINKGQASAIARFRKRIEKSALHPKVKAKVLKEITKAQTSVLESNAEYQRVHAEVTRYGGRLSFSPAWGRRTVIYFSGTRADDVSIFRSHKKSDSAYRARTLTDTLTTVYRGRRKGFSEKESFSLITTERTRATKLTRRLWERLYYRRGEALKPQLEKMLAASTPAKLDLRGKRVRAVEP